MADDLTLKVLLQTILDAKGFEDAQEALKKFAAAANNAGNEGKKSGERIGGARGPVADLTRVLLQQIGVSQGAGEAAKFAGVGLTAMQTAAAGASLALTGATAGIALLVPLVIQWIAASRDQNKEQEDINKKIKEAVPDLEKYVTQLKHVNESLKIQVAFEHSKTMKEEASELQKLTESQRLDTQTRQKGLPVTIQSHEELEKNRARQHDLTEAQALGITVAEMYERRIKSQTEAFKEQDDSLDKLAERDVQIANERVDAGAQRAKDNEDQSRDAIRDINAFGRAQQDANRKAIELDSELTSARTKNAELQRQAEVDLAQARIESEEMVASAALGTLSAFFPKQKAFAIAQALIDMYAGANKALGQGGFFGIAMAAAVIANGLANVANIRKQEVGFDDPFNDLLAEKLGRKSAADFVKYFGVGFQGGMASAGVTNNYSTQHVTNNNGMSVGSFHTSAIVGSKATQSLVDLNRELKRIDRRIERRTQIGR